MAKLQPGDKYLSIKLAGHEYVSAFKTENREGTQPHYKGDGVAVWVKEKKAWRFPATHIKVNALCKVFSDLEITKRAKEVVKHNKDINDITVTPVIQPLFSSNRDIAQPRVILPFGLTTSNTVFTLTHNVLYPYRPMFLVSITDPILYLKVTYNEVLSDRVDPVVVTEYISIPLNDLDPDRVN
jgi:hypothetical protein